MDKHDLFISILEQDVFPFVEDKMSFADLKGLFERKIFGSCLVHDANYIYLHENLHAFDLFNNICYAYTHS